jgi:homoserine O-acetyltransferase
MGAAFKLSTATRTPRLAAPLALESGTLLPGVELAFRSWGRLSPQADNAIVICHALTGSADADDWWQAVIGPGKAIDTDRYFVVCSNVLGGCYGSTGPASLAPDGDWWGARFPALTIRDQVAAQVQLADALGLRGIHAVIGGSLGGLQALEWAWLDPARVRSVVSMAASGRHSAWCVAWSEAQRMALEADPRYRGGRYAREDPPLCGLAAARAMAMVGYRSPCSLQRRFDRRCGQDGQPFAVREWLRFHGAALVDRFDAHSYRVLLDAMDTHDLARGRGDYAQVLGAMRLPALIGSIASDALYLPHEQFELVRLLPNAELLQIDSPHGHDGFLIDAQAFAGELAEFLSRV